MLDGSTNPPFAASNSWFIVNRSVMETVAFNESMFGYGWEDIEWLIRADLSGYWKGHNSTIVIHNFHDAAERRINPVLEKRNSDITKAARAFWLEWGMFSPKEGKTRVVSATHRDWSSNLVFHPTRSALFHAEYNRVAEYRQLGRAIQIEWKNDRPELFEPCDGVLRQCEPAE
jgi:hypothetical protein